MISFCFWSPSCVFISCPSLIKHLFSSGSFQFIHWVAAIYVPCGAASCHPPSGLAGRQRATTMKVTPLHSPAVLLKHGFGSILFLHFSYNQLKWGKAEHKWSSWGILFSHQVSISCILSIPLVPLHHCKDGSVRLFMPVAPDPPTQAENITVSSCMHEGESAVLGVSTARVEGVTWSTWSVILCVFTCLEYQMSAM